jgi:hypothetical protein
MLLEKKWVLLIYNLVIWFLFFGIYSGLMEKENFKIDNDEYNPGTAAYFTTVVHATVGFGDVLPISAGARAAVTIHIALVILGSLGVFLLPLEQFVLPTGAEMMGRLSKFNYAIPDLHTHLSGLEDFST